MSTPIPHQHLELARNFFSAPQFTAALTLAIIGTELGTLFLQEIIGWAGLVGVLATLVVLAGLSLMAKQREIEWHGLLPISLLVFVIWAGISVFWSLYQWATLGGVVYLGAVTMLGIYVALVRDTIQIARAFGDVLRVALVLSLVIELFSGLLIDTPLPFLNIKGDLGAFGPLQGIFGARNQLGIVALVALVTFGTELRTRSIGRPLGIASLIVGGLSLLLARSPIAAGAFAVLVVAVLALYGLRRVKPERKRFWQIGLLVASIAIAAVAWGYRTPIITALSASSELKLRLAIWQQLRGLIPLNELQGGGWVGHWPRNVQLFQTFPNSADATPISALNAFLDVWFQLGFVGLCIFVGMIALTFVRSWLLASRQRSIVYAWPALVLVVLITTALAESSILVEFGWLTFVVCCVKASRELSWRKAFATTAAPPEPPIEP